MGGHVRSGAKAAVTKYESGEGGGRGAGRLRKAVPAYRVGKFGAATAVGDLVLQLRARPALGPGDMDAAGEDTEAP